MQYLLFEDESHADLLPLTYTRPIWDLRVGILKLSEKWDHVLTKDLGKSETPGRMASGYLKAAFDAFNPTVESIGFNGKFFPDPELVGLISKEIAPDTFWCTANGEVLAFRGTPDSCMGDGDGPVSKELLEKAGFKSNL